MIKLNPLTGNFDDVGFPARTITGTTNQITVTNGDGVSGNPTLSLPQDIHTGASPTFAGGTVNGAYSASSGGQYATTIAPAISQTGTAGYTALLVNPTETTTGSGNKYMLDLQTGGSSKFSVSTSLISTQLLYKGRNIEPSIDSAYRVGSSTLYYAEMYTDRLYLNSTAYLDGSTAGVAALTGKLSVNGIQSIYVPNQTDFAGSMFLGNGGNSLSHTTGDDGFRNIGVGLNALNAVTTGCDNVAISRALLNNTTGSGNMGIGSFALGSNTTGGSNIAVGTYALGKNVDGRNNTAIGDSALYYNTGYSNTAIGRAAGFTKTSGDGNVFIGYNAGYNETGSNKLYIANSNTATPLIGGDFSANTIVTPASIEITDTAKGVILKSPDGTRYRITVANGGTLNIAVA